MRLGLSSFIKSTTRRRRLGSKLRSRTGETRLSSITVEPIDDASCLAHVGADSPEILTQYLAMLGADFELVDAPELRRHVLALGRRLLRAARELGDSRSARQLSRGRGGSRQGVEPVRTC